MGDEEAPKLVNVDPRCIQEALRMYFQPIKNDDPKLDFFTMYKRETTEYDTEYMNKYNEDLNTTLIFAGLFSAVSSAFVIAIQPGLQPDSGERSEAYLRAILLSLNPSISPGENPAAPQVWTSPPREIITTSDLLYASLLMSLLAAFVAMLGKQWVNKYLRHTGGSVIERCGDRQRKVDGLEKWPFRFFIESLPIMLQIALLLLTCALSRYMWLVNTSVACVVISFTVLGFLFYIGIVVAGTSSYECPFQTPVSVALRHLWDSGIVRKMLAPLFPPNAIKPVLQILQAFLTRGWRLFQLAPQLRTRSHTVPLFPEDDSELQLNVWNIESIRKQNVDSARCVCWVLRNITDPEAIDSAIRLAGTIRWFNGDLEHDPPFDTIVSIFQTCFDSIKQVYPGMRDRAYFTARAILQINVRARARSNEHAFRYPIPAVSSSSVQHADPDLYNILYILEHHSDDGRSTLQFPDAHTCSHSHSLWTSNLLVEMTHVGPNPTLESYESYLSAATINHKPVIVNILLVWYMFLGGRVEEDTFWAVDKSDSLQAVLSHLSTRVMNLIPNGRGVEHLKYLLTFLKAWEKRPIWFTPMAYRWSSAISEAAKGAELRRTSTLRFQFLQQEFSEVGPGCDLFRLGNTSYHTRRAPRKLVHQDYEEYLLLTIAIAFRMIGPETDRSIYLGHTHHHDWMFEVAFSSDDDDVIADAASAWIASNLNTPPGSFVQYFAKRIDEAEPFSPRLKLVVLRVVERIWEREFKKSWLEAARFLDHLEVNVDDILIGGTWLRLLVSVIRSPAGPESLSSPYWRLLDKLVLDTEEPCFDLTSSDVEVMILLEEAESWEKLEIWLAVMWQGEEFMEEVERVTLVVLSRRPSVLQRFENLSRHPPWVKNQEKIQRICRQAEQMPQSIHAQRSGGDTF